VLRAPRTIWRIPPLRHDAFEPELARGGWAHGPGFRLARSERMSPRRPWGSGGQWVAGISVAASSFDLWILFCGGGEPIGVVARRQLSSLSRPKSARGSSSGAGARRCPTWTSPRSPGLSNSARCVLQLPAVPPRRDAVRASGRSRHEFRVTRNRYYRATANSTTESGLKNFADIKAIIPNAAEPEPQTTNLCPCCGGAEIGLNSCKRALAEGFHSRVARPGPESFYVRLPC
jgi:hypothetical protein